MQPLLILIVVLLALALMVAGFFLWKFSRAISALSQQVTAPQEMETDLGIIKTHLQSLPGALGDIGAVKSQVESMNRTVQQLEAIKSQVEALSGSTETIGGIQSQVETINTAVQQLEAIKSQVETLSSATSNLGGIQSQVEAITQTVQQLGSIKTDLEHVKGKETQLQETINRIASKLVGTRDVGEAGENILAEAFACFPPGWIERDFRIGGKVVEFALVLPNQKRLPIDSKFPAVLPLERLGVETDPGKRQEIVRQIENAVLLKAQEAKKYIDPSRTIYLAIAAVPDAAYSVCRKAHFDAIGSDVLVISYSIALPVVLALYKFQLQYATSIDQQNLESYLLDIESCLKRIEKNLENRIKDAGSMINNAYNECMSDIGKVRAALSALRTPSLPASEPREIPESKTEQLIP